MDSSPASTWKRAPADHELWRSMIQNDMRWHHSLQNPFLLRWRQAREAPLPPSSSLQQDPGSASLVFPRIAPIWPAWLKFLPYCPTGSSSYRWRKSPVPRISSPSPQIWDYLIPLWGSLVWLFSPLKSFCPAGAASEPTHWGSDFALQDSGNTMYVNVEALILPELVLLYPSSLTGVALPGKPLPRAASNSSLFCTFFNLLWYSMNQKTMAVV